MRPVQARRFLLTFTAALSFGCGLSAVRAADSVNIRGTVATIEGDAVTIRTDDEKTVALTLGENWKIAGVVSARVEDIKQGMFIGTANIADAGGNTALEVVVFPEALRGSGEGDYGWDLKPKSSMTNATVDALVEGVSGRTMMLSYKGGTKKVTIPPGTPIVTIAPGGGKGDVKPGAKVFIAGTPAADPGKLDKGFIAVGLDGATPPM